MRARKEITFITAKKIRVSIHVRRIQIVWCCASVYRRHWSTHAVCHSNSWFTACCNTASTPVFNSHETNNILMLPACAIYAAIMGAGAGLWRHVVCTVPFYLGHRVTQCSLSNLWVDCSNPIFTSMSVSFKPPGVFRVFVSPVPKDHQYEMAYGESNGRVTMTSGDSKRWRSWPQYT